MAGKGPAPKHPSVRRRRNAEVVPIRTLELVRMGQPELPPIEVYVDGKPVDYVWPQITQDWWDSWEMSPLSKDFGPTDWAFLMETAFLHAEFWKGNLTVAGELRLRVAKFGATPEDRLRLKIQFEEADAAGAAGEKRREAEREEAQRSASRDDGKPDPRKLLAQ